MIGFRDASEFGSILISIITPRKTPAPINGIVRKHERLGGMLNYYHREAA
jgi:hypothetical protein